MLAPTRKPPSAHNLKVFLILLLSVISMVLSSLQPEVELQEDSPEIYRPAPNLESLVVINSRLLSRLLSPGMDLDHALARLRGHGLALWGVQCSHACPRPLGVSLGQFRRMHRFVCVLGVGQVYLSVHGWRPEVERSLSLCAWEHSDACTCVLGENLSRCALFWGILSVPVWAFAGFINLHPLGLFTSLRSRSSGVFQYWSPLCELASLRKWFWVISFQPYPFRFPYPP